MRIVHRQICLALFAAAGAFTALAAEPPFAGTWKLNLAKSQLTGQTFSVEQKAGGMFRFDGQGFAYDFDLSGKDYPTPDGGTISFHAVNPTTWEGTARMNGKVVMTFHMSVNGNTEQVVEQMIKPDGSATEETSTWTRASGGPGFPGKWKSTKIGGAPSTLEIATDGQNGITYRSPEGQVVCKGNFDGKDYVVSEAGAPSKETMSFQKTGPNSFKMTTKVNGKPFFTDVITVSADGKTLTDDGNAVSVNEPIKAVYDRQ
jgi:hypothetical protein